MRFAIWVALQFSLLITSRVATLSGERPELVTSRSNVWYTNKTALNVDFELAVVRMEFDQPLYTTGHSFLCPSVDQSCPTLECTPCDWSGQQPTGCGDLKCCGPSQEGNTELAESWCDPNLPPYETLVLGETSRKFSMEQGETMYYRFFMPEEYYCQPALVILRPYYGTASLFLSTLEPTPGYTTVNGWVRGGPYPTYGFGQSFFSICPVVNAEYNVGTYAGGVFAVEPVEFVIEILVAQQKYPLAPPPVRINCDDIPEEEFRYAELGGDPVICLEDGVSTNFTGDDLSEAGFIQFLTAVPKGHHTYSIAITGLDGELSTSMYCLPSMSGVALGVRNALLARISQTDLQLVWTGNFEDDVTYVMCGIRFTSQGSATWQIAFSTQSEVVRRKLTDIPSSSLTYQDANQAGTGVVFGRAEYACYDFFLQCMDWVITPTSDPLFLFPPSSLLDFYGSNQDLQQWYIDSGLATVEENTIIIVVGFEIRNLVLLPQTGYDQVSIALPKITNEFGEPVLLPNNGFDENPVEDEHRISRFISNIALLDIPEYQLPKEKYAIYQELVNEKLLEVPEQTTVIGTQFIQYSLDVIGAAKLATTCVNEVAANVEMEETYVELQDQTTCNEQPGSAAWLFDPCCSPFMIPFSCCLPEAENQTLDLYTQQANVSGCGVPQCAESYYEELSFSLNYVDDPTLGCTNGIENYADALSVFLIEIFEDQFIDCLNQVGFGADYLGIFCQENSECDHLEGICYQNRCVVSNLKQLEDDFLDCYIYKMSSSTESYLKKNILPPSVSDVPKTSPVFRSALFEAASGEDCVNLNNPLDLSFRTRYQFTASNLACLTLNLGYSYPDEIDLALRDCPPGVCLGTFCKMNYTGCTQLCDWDDFHYIQATDELCPDEPECVVDDSGACTGTECVYCPPNGELPCLQVPGIVDEETCQSSIACELPDGSIEFGLTESECREKDARCTMDCVGESCESIVNMEGVCYVSGGGVDSLDSCNSYGLDNSVEVEWYQDSLCVLVDVSSVDSCEDEETTRWETCQQNTLDQCTGEPIPQRYLGCYESKWHACSTQEECEVSGSCSDREFTVIVKSAEYPIDVQYGACMDSGEYCGTYLPCCLASNEPTGIGCRSTPLSRLECRTIPVPLIFRHWVEPAMTQEECLAATLGRRGCQIWSVEEDNLLWILDQDQCVCRGGSLQDRWEWTPGVWQGGIPRSLQWKTIETSSPFVMENFLSFVLLSDWLSQSTEEKFLFSLKSEIICESESIKDPVFTLVCDCLSSGEEQGEHCYVAGEQDKEVLMGLNIVCQGESSFVKDPSAQVTFNENSVLSDCSFVNISIIYRNWFGAPYIPPPVSFKWQKQQERGVVINKRGATVGEVLGDGLVLSFTTSENIGVFRVCLRVSVPYQLDLSEVPDFGYSNSELVFIYPVGLEGKQLEIENRNSIIWFCSEIDLQTISSNNGVVRLFPIERKIDFEDEETDYASHTTTSLMYTLGACYCFIGFWCVIALILQFFQSSISLPLFVTVIFFLLCIFRAVFMFLYPEGRLEDEPVAYFVIFEIPTFLLFSILVYAIYSFKRVVYKKGFFPKDKAKYILFIGLPLVWSLWLIVTLVYSEAIVDGSSGESPCEGRVAVSYDEEEDKTRTLAIVYQSIIIAVTLFLGGIFFFYSHKLYKSAKRMAETKQFVVVIGAIFTFAFLLRSILFLIILAADFESSVYMFITLFITEVLMMTLLLIQFNKRQVQRAGRSATSSATSMGSFRSNTQNASHHHSAMMDG